MMTKVDHSFAIGRSVAVKDIDAITAVKAAYNEVAQAFQTAAREPALVVVTVYAAPQQKG